MKRKLSFFTSLLLVGVMFFSSCGDKKSSFSTEQLSAKKTETESNIKNSEPTTEQIAEQITETVSEISSEVNVQAVTMLPNTIFKEYNGIKISVEPSIELLAVIQYLSNYKDLGLISRFDTTYKNDIRKYFADVKKHEAVKLIEKYMKKGFSYDLPPNDAILINKDFTLNEEVFKSSSDHNERTEADIYEFVKVMKSFYEDSNFEAFYNEHTDYYTKIIDNTIELFPDWPMIAAMEEFYGFEMESYNLVLASLFHPGGYGGSNLIENGLRVYSFQGPGGVENGYPVFGSSEGFTGLALHEFGHSFIPISKKSNDGDVPQEITETISKSEYLMKPIKKEMESSAYPWWDIACEELVLRAVVIHMQVDNQQMRAEELFEYEKNAGFMYIETVYDIINNYKADRETYPTFNDFIPVLLDELMKAYPET